MFKKGLLSPHSKSISSLSLDKPPTHGPCKALDFELEMVNIFLLFQVSWNLKNTLELFYGTGIKKGNVPVFS